MDREELFRSTIWRKTSRDLDEVLELGAELGWDLEYIPQGSGSRSFDYTGVALPGFFLTREAAQGGLVACLGAPKDFSPFLVPVRTEDAHLNGIPYAEGDVWTPGDATEMTIVQPERSETVTLEVSPETMRELGDMVGHDDRHRFWGGGVRRFRASPQNVRALQGLLASLLQEDAWPLSLEAWRAKALAASALERLAAVLMDARSTESEYRRLRRSLWVRHADQARAYLEGNLNRAVTLAELCRVTGTTARTIQYAFRDQFGVSPQAYHKARRMSAVHQALSHRWPGETTVTEAAFDHGFWHLGRFSQAYKKLIGELPSETLARRPVRPAPASPIPERATIASSRREIGPRWRRSGDVLSSKKRGGDRCGPSRAVLRRTAGSQGAAD